jgi:hypothetical protein
VEMQLNASEITNLWTTYITNTASVCLIRTYLQHVEDLEILKFLEQALHNSEKSVTGSKLLLETIKYPIPLGFNEADINLKAPRLYSDKFFLFDIRRFSEYGMIVIGLALSTSLEKKVRDFYADLLSLNIALFNQASDLSLAKGVHTAPPNIPIPEQIKFSTKESILKDLLGKPRTINGLEIKEIVFSLVGMIHGKALLLGFSQVARSEEVREHFIKGKEIASKHIKVLRSILKEEDLPTIETFEMEVTEATEPPFSDKLMMFLTTSLSQLVFARYGIAISQSARGDIMTDLTRLMAETGLYLKDGFTLMIEQSWLEQPPMASNREALVINKI